LVLVLADVRGRRGGALLCPPVRRISVPRGMAAASPRRLRLPPETPSIQGFSVEGFRGLGFRI